MKKIIFPITLFAVVLELVKFFALRRFWRFLSNEWSVYFSFAFDIVIAFGLGYLLTKFRDFSKLKVAGSVLSDDGRFRCFGDGKIAGIPHDIHWKNVNFSKSLKLMN